MIKQVKRRIVYLPNAVYFKPRGDCMDRWNSPFVTGRPAKCPKCASQEFHRIHDVEKVVK